MTPRTPKGPTGKRDDPVIHPGERSLLRVDSGPGTITLDPVIDAERKAMDHFEILLERMDMWHSAGKTLGGTFDTRPDGTDRH